MVRVAANPPPFMSAPRGGRARRSLVMLKLTRKPFVAAALALAECAVGPRAAVWAEEKMADEHMKRATEHMDKMKMMAGDQNKARQLTSAMATMMVMDHMAMQMRLG